ncbi:MAG: hypothetical protein ACK5H4_15625 [Lacrimispora sphenoides]
MIIGEIVERLIGIKDEHNDLFSGEYQAIIEACNLLAKLPRLEEATSYEPVKN